MHARMHTHIHTRTTHVHTRTRRPAAVLHRAPVRGDQLGAGGAGGGL